MMEVFVGVLSDHERKEDDKGGVVDNPRRRFVEPCTQKADGGRVRSSQLGAKERLKGGRLCLRALLVGPPGGGGARLARLVIGGDRLLEETRGDRMGDSKGPSEVERDHEAGLLAPSQEEGEARAGADAEHLRIGEDHHGPAGPGEKDVEEALVVKEADIVGAIGANQRNKLDVPLTALPGVDRANEKRLARTWARGLIVQRGDLETWPGTTASPASLRRDSRGAVANEATLHRIWSLDAYRETFQVPLVSSVREEAVELVSLMEVAKGAALPELAAFDMDEEESEGVTGLDGVWREEAGRERLAT